jgi:hypothetical protein
MAALSADKPRQYDPAVEPMFTDVEIKSATTIYEGAFCSDDGGNGVVDALAASEAFLGIAEKQVVNATSGTSRARLRQKGILKNVAVTGLDNDTDMGVAVYAITSGDLTLTSSTTHVQIGKVVGYNDASGYGDVYFEAAAVRSI